MCPSTLEQVTIISPEITVFEVIGFLCSPGKRQELRSQMPTDKNEYNLCFVLQNRISPYWPSMQNCLPPSAPYLVNICCHFNKSSVGKILPVGGKRLSKIGIGVDDE